MLRIIYAGTPEFAVPALQALQLSEHQLVAVYTQPDRPAGRGRTLQPSPVKQFAESHQIPVIQPQNFKQTSDIDQLKSFDADLMVVTAYGIILPQAVLDLPRYGCINIHASLLPRWRGAAPIQRAIQAGDARTGITIMQMDRGLDTGNMLAKVEMAIAPGMDAGQLHDELKNQGAELLLDVIHQITQSTLKQEPQQEEQATYAAKLSKQEAAIDWHKSSIELAREIRAFNPWPVSYTKLDDQLVKIWQAEVTSEQTSTQPGGIIRHDKTGIFVACDSAVLKITQLQFAGKKRHSADQVLNARDLTGCHFG